MIVHRSTPCSLIPESAAGFGLTNGDGTSHPLDVLKVVNRRLLVSFAAEIHKCETTLATRLPIERQGAFAHFAVLTKQMDQILPLSVPGEISNKDRQKKNGSRLLTFAYKRTTARKLAHLPRERVASAWPQRAIKRVGSTM